MRAFGIAVAVFLASLSTFAKGDSIPSAPLILANTNGQPLRQPGEAGIRDGSAYHITLRYSTARFVGPSFDSYIRVYNGTSPGPTWRLRQGDKVTLTLINDLAPQPHANMVNNEFRMPNTTNIHTHGLHDSGMDPSDNIFVDIGPGENHTYQYTIDSNHMPGTYWTHPHWHGSTTIQTGQGAAGAIIVEDPDEYLPREVAEMPEVVMVLLHMGFGSSPDDYTDIQKAAIQSNSTLQSSPPVVTNATIRDNTNVVLINAQFQPVVEMEENKWYRWRMVHTSSENSIILAPEGDSDCDLRLLAKDGIYLSSLGRPVPKIVLSPGNRADVAVRCRKAGSFQLLTDSTTSFQGFGLSNYSAPFDRISTANGNDARIVATLDVSAATSAESAVEDLSDIGTQSAARPCYLVDLTSLPDSKVSSTFTVDLDGKGGRKTFNGQEWQNETHHINEYKLGTVQQIILPGSGRHPYHQHVNPFQLQEISFAEPQDFDSTAGGWYMPGDWQDTFLHPDTAANVTMRFQVDRFTGNMIAHCHILMHEDMGMMAQYLLSGNPGEWWTGAKTVNPSCSLPTNSPLPIPHSADSRRKLFSSGSGSSRPHRKLSAFHHTA